MPDHVHVLLRMSTTVSIAECVKKMKGVSSKYGNEAILHEEHFSWQGCYGAFSIGYTEIIDVTNYIRFQQKHHAENMLRVDLEQCGEFIDESSF